MKRVLFPAMLSAIVVLSACGKPTQSPLNPQTVNPVINQQPPDNNNQPPVTQTQPKPPEPPPIKWVVNTLFGPIETIDPAGKEKKVVLLTFDDGPNPETTARVLDTLKQNNVRALFFVTGNADRYPDILKRIDAEGHLIGTHTLYHENLREQTKEKQRQVITVVNKMVEKIIGKKPKYFRPPFGAYNDNTLAIMQDLGMQLINWDHGSGDWMDVKNGYKDPKIVIQDVLAEVPRNNQMTPLHKGAIILMHDTLKHTAEALPEIIQGLRAKGFDFVTPES